LRQNEKLIEGINIINSSVSKIFQAHILTHTGLEKSFENPLVKKF